MGTLEDYFAFKEAHPALFENPPGAAFKILTEVADIREAESEGGNWLKEKKRPTKWAQVGIAYQDQYAMILRYAVEFPNKKKCTYIRMAGHDDPRVIVHPTHQEQVL